MALLLHEIRFVSDENARVRIERQELTRCLREAMAWHDEHGLVAQAEPALLRDRGRDGERLAGADGVGGVDASGGDDAPDGTLVVPVEREKAPEAPRSAIVAMCWRAKASALSMVPEEVTNAARPPGLRRSIDLAMK
jgi:hypothetical protein